MAMDGKGVSWLAHFGALLWINLSCLLFPLIWLAWLFWGIWKNRWTVGEYSFSSRQLYFNFQMVSLKKKGKRGRGERG